MLKRNFQIFVLLLASFLVLLIFFAINFNILNVGFEKKVYSLPQTGTIVIGEKQFDDNSNLDWVSRSHFVINNRNPNYDIIVIVTYQGSKDPIVGYFIRNESRFGVPVRDGDYDLYICSGQNWNPITKKFERNPTYNKFPFSVSVPIIINGDRYLVYEISLEKNDGSYGGLSGFSPVLKEDFPPLLSE